MIRVRPYELTDRFQFEKMMKTYYQTKKIFPPDSQYILDTIGFYMSFPQCGKIYIILFKNVHIGYAIVTNKWNPLYGKISYEIDELYIDHRYYKYKPEINLIEFLVKNENIYSLEVEYENLKVHSRGIFRFLKFERTSHSKFVKLLNGGHME